MPGKSEKIKSKSQLRWAFAAENRGKLSKGTAERWAKEVDVGKLPEKVKKQANLAKMAYDLGFKLVKLALNVDNLYNSKNPAKDLQEMLKNLPEEKFLTPKRRERSLFSPDLKIHWGMPRTGRSLSYIL